MAGQPSNRDATGETSTLPPSQAQRLALSSSRSAIERASSAPPGIEDPASPSSSLPETSPGQNSQQSQPRSPLSYPSPDFQSKSKTNQKPFSHSAAKRESVMALGSIAGFQKFYARQGLAAASPPMATKGGKLALGPAAAAARGGSLPPSAVPAPDHQHEASDLVGDSIKLGQASRRGDEEDAEVEVPRSTWKGKLFPDVARPVEADLDSLKLAMAGCLEMTRQQWLLTNANANANLTSCIDVVDLVASTIKTVRAVRSYFLALPPQNLVAPPRKEIRSSSSRLRKEQSFCQEGAQIKPRDSFKRQSISHTLGRRASTVLLSSGFAAPAADKSVGSRRSNSRAPSSFFPFQTVRRLSYASAEASTGEDAASRDLARDIRNIFAATEAMAHTGTSTASVRDFRSDRSASPTSSDEENSTGNISGADPLVLIRSVGLEVLGMLKQLENSTRLSDSVHDTGGDGEAIKPADESETGQYRTDVTLGSLAKEREVVRNYLVEVEEILNRLPRDARKQERGQRAASYSGTTEDLGLRGLHLRDETDTNLTSDARHCYPDHTLDGSDGDSSLPAWAQAKHATDHLERARAILCDVLPVVYPDLRPTVEHDQLASASQEQLLIALSDGQLLCHAFNAALRRSSKPWGFIPSASIHDVRADEEQRIPSRSRSVNASHASSTGRQTPSEMGDEMDSASTPLGDVHRKPGWTFRRVENLNKFIVAIGLRYGIKSGGAKQDVSGRHSKDPLDTISDISVAFDAVRVVRQEGDWQEMLRSVVEQWTVKVVEEERNGR